MKLISRIIAIIAILAALIAPQYKTHAKATQRFFGTGFFVTQHGDLITNAHIVRNCKKVYVAGAVNAPATIAALDEMHDLALLKIDGIKTHLAPLRLDSHPIRPGQNVAIIGYPGRAIHHQSPVFRTAQLLSLKGPIGEPYLLQFTSSTEKGNSGGPLLDSAGNVVGVITGKISLDWTDPTTPDAPTISVHQADIAITLPYLRNFLSQNNIHPNTGGSGLVRVNALYVNQTAQKFIARVHCES